MTVLCCHKFSLYGNSAWMTTDTLSEDGKYETPYGGSDTREEWSMWLKLETNTFFKTKFSSLSSQNAYFA